MVYTDGTNILGGNISTLNKNLEALVVPREEFCLEVNAEKSMYMVVLRPECRTELQHKDR